MNLDVVHDRMEKTKRHAEVRIVNRTLQNPFSRVYSSLLRNERLYNDTWETIEVIRERIVEG